MRTIKKDDITCDFIFKDNFVSGIKSSPDYHFHSFFELFTVTKGIMHIMVEDQDFWLQPESVCIIAPKVIHYVFESDDAFFVGFRFAFSPNAQYNKPHFQSRFQKAFGGIQKAFIIKNASIYSNFLYAASGIFSANPYDHTIEELLFMAVNQASFCIIDESPEALSPARSDRFMSSYIEEFINTYYSESPKLEDLAKALGLSVRQTQRIISQLFGLTFSELLQKRRLTVARFMLQKTSLPIEEIAFQTGFYDKSYFHRVFTNHIGITPLKYRNKYKNE